MKKREPIRQGEEKFFLKNGDSYALVRPGKWDIFLSFLSAHRPTRAHHQMWMFSTSLVPIRPFSNRPTNFFVTHVQFAYGSLILSNFCNSSMYA